MLSEGEVTPSPPSASTRTHIVNRRWKRPNLSLNNGVMAEAESFLNALENEISPRSAEEGEINSASPTHVDTDETSVEMQIISDKAAHRRRESQIWEGDFESASVGRKRKRLEDDLDDENENSDWDSRNEQVLVHLSPGACIYKRGCRTASIVKIVFEVDEQTAGAVERWKELCSGPQEACLRVDFGCYLKRALCSDRFGAEPIAPPLPSFSRAVLCLQLGDGLWTPPSLAALEKPVDISHFIKPGRNELEIIQTSDCSSLQFAVFATQPSSKDILHAKKLARLREYVQS